MKDALDRYAESAFVLLTAGAAMIWAPLALLTAGAYLLGLAYLHYRAAAAEPEATP